MERKTIPDDSELMHSCFYHSFMNSKKKENQREKSMFPEMARLGLHPAIGQFPFLGTFSHALMMSTLSRGEEKI